MDDLDTRLAALITRAADDVEPTDRLAEIRGRTAGQRRGWPVWWATGGAAVAAAAVVTAVALGQADRSTLTEPDPAPAPSPTATADPTDEPTAGEDTVAVPVYFVGDSPTGPRLFREFQRVGAADRLLAAARAAVAGDAQDPDYRSGWPAGTVLEEVAFDGVGADGLIEVTLADASVRDRPAGLSEEEAGLAVEQVIYTLQGVVGARAPVQFLLGGNPVDQVLGVPAGEPLANAPVLQTLNLVSLDRPEEGTVVDDGSLEVTGAANSHEANVVLTLERQDGTVALQEPVTATGWMGERLFPFEGTLDVGDVAPGTYRLIASTDDPSGGAEGPGAFTDDRLVVIE